MRHDFGVLAATTAFGKTVVAAWLIAQRGVNALILVHRRQLLDQWIERLSTFLGLPRKSIGRIGGGQNAPTGIVDVAIIQSLVKNGVVDDRLDAYGHLIVDECQLRSNPIFCGALDYDGGGTISNIRRQYQNLDKTNNSGIDVELAYRLPLDGLFSWTAGDLRFRVLAMHLLEDSTTAFIGGVKNDNAGEWATPDWRAFVFATYELDAFSATVDWRWFSGGVLDNTRVYGQISANGTNVDELDALHYTNLTLTYRLPFGDTDRTSVYLRVNNLFDREPPYPLNGGGFVDEIGRAYRAGVRIGF